MKMTIEQIEARKAEIAQLINQPDADLEALNNEADELNAELEARKADAKLRESIRTRVAEGAGTVSQKQPETTIPTLDEIRKSAAYVDAFAHYVKTGDDRECRTLLTTNAASNGSIPVPTIVEDYVRTAWEQDTFLSRVKKTYIRGNLKVAFEKDTDAAYVHGEGTSAPTEEDLEIGIVTLTPSNIKKWIKISDETLAMAGPLFLQYVYDEVSHQIAAKLVSLLVADVTGANTTHGATAVGVPKAAVAAGLAAVPTAYANLSDEARDICVVINRLSYATFYAAYAAANFAMDPFMNLPVIYTSALPAYATASEGDTYGIVGDLSALQVNFPEGDGIVFKMDDTSLAELDLVKLVGREYAGHGITAPGRLCRLTVPTTPATT